MLLSARGLLDAGVAMSGVRDVLRAVGAVVRVQRSNGQFDRRAYSAQVSRMKRWILLLAVWLDRDRLGLEHTLYLYRSLIDGR